MQNTPDILMEWSEMDWVTGHRDIKPDAPGEVKKLAVEYEREFYRKTGRRMFDNVDLQAGTVE